MRKLTQDGTVCLSTCFFLLKLSKGTAGGLWDDPAGFCICKTHCFSMPSWEFLGRKRLLSNLSGEGYSTSQVQTDYLSRKLGWYNSVAGVAVVLILNWLLSLNSEGAGRLSWTLQISVMGAERSGDTVPLSLEKSPLSLLWQFVWSFLACWLLIIKETSK